MASPHRSRLPPRTGLRPRPRHLRRLPHQHHCRLQRAQTCPRPRTRRRPPPLRHEVHHHTPQPVGRRPHPPRSRRRRPVRPRQPPHPLSPLPPRSHLPTPHAPQPRPPDQALQVVSMTLSYPKSCRFPPAKCTQKPPNHHKFTTYFVQKKAQFPVSTTQNSGAKPNRILQKPETHHNSPQKPNKR